MKKLMITAVAAALAGCLTCPQNFVASSIPVEQGKYAVLGDTVRGSSTQISWLFFTFGKDGSVQRHALEDAVSQVSGCDGLTSMAIDSETFCILPISLITIPVFPTFYTVTVTGTPIKLNAD